MQRQKIFFILLTYYLIIPILGKAQNHSGIEQLLSSLNHTSNETFRVAILSEIADSLYAKDKISAEKYAKEAVSLLAKVSEDTIKLKALYSLYHLNLAQKKYTKCKSILDTALIISTDILNKKYLWNAYFSLGKLYKKQRKYLEAINYFNQALTLSEVSVAAQEKIDLKNNLGTSYRNIGEMASAENLFLENLQHSKQLGKEELIAKSLFFLGEFYRRKRENETAKKYLLKALDLWKKTANRKGVFTIYNSLGIMNKNQGNYNQALEYYNLSMPYIQDAKDEALLYSNQGVLYKNQGDFAAALAAYAKAEKIYALQKDSFQLQKVSVNKGIVYKRKGEFNLALKHFQEELKYREKIGDPFFTAASYRRLCDVCLKLKDYDLVLKYAQKAFELSVSIDDKAGLVNVHAYRGEVYQIKEQYKQAEIEFRKENLLAKEIGAKLSEAISLKNLGEALWKQERFGEAMNCQFEALEKVNLTGSKISQISIVGLIAGHLIELKHKEEKEFALNFQAWTKFDLERNLLQALADAEEIGDFQNQQLIYNVLAEFYEYKKDFERAYKFKTKYAIIKDSVFTQNKTITLAEMQTKFETERTEKENELLKVQNDLIKLRNRNYLIASSLLLALLLLGGILYWQLGRAKNKLQTQNKTIELQNLELLSLNKTKDRFFGIIAHDLRSPILAFQGVGKQINHYLKKDDKEKLTRLGQMINHTAIKLNRLLDNLLNWALLQTGRIPYHPQHLDVLEMIEEIEELFLPVAQTKNISITTSIEPALSIYADEQALDTTLRNLVSNAVKFTKEGGKIFIKAYRDREQIIFLIEDTGIGIPPEILQSLFRLHPKSIKGTAGEKGTGLGLLLCKELSTLNKGSIEVESKRDKGTCFKLTFPMAKNTLDT